MISVISITRKEASKKGTMRTHLNDMPSATPAAALALARLFAAKAAGEPMNTPKEVIDRAGEAIKGIITAAMHGIDSGVCGEPTPEDLQRLHELRSILDDLP